ncbi:MAG: TOBE domain-containing protein [Leptolyngbyaceae cyanobacterium SM2_3_12]|nr:TOBE domain-containing protein [Leptolyngbyaceae cyanobacterium SM2_3_12]
MPRKSQGWITFQASAEERKILEDYCQRHQRSKTDILRELVRGLERADASADLAAEPDVPTQPQDLPVQFATKREEQEFLQVQREFAISARNLLRARVQQVAIDGVNAEITLAVSPGVELVAIITQQSAKRLGLAPGKEVYAVIKSSNVMVAAIAP